MLKLLIDSSWKYIQISVRGFDFLNLLISLYMIILRVNDALPPVI